MAFYKLRVKLTVASGWELAASKILEKGASNITPLGGVPGKYKRLQSLDGVYEK